MVQQSDQVIFDLRLTNTGNTPLATVPLVDAFNADELTFESASVTPSSTGVGSLTWGDLGPLAVGQTKISAYALTGLFSALAGLSLTASTGIGTPVPGPYTLMSVAAVVLGGVSLAGGRGGLFGPIVAVVVLQMIRTDMTFLSIDSNYAYVAQGLILVGVVMVGSFAQMRRSRA